MGFWDKLGEVVQTVGEYANSKSEEIEQYKEEYERYFDEQLIRRFKNIPSSNRTRKIACMQVLRERGIGNTEE